MGYPENVLADDEQVVLHRHPHWKRLIGPAVVLMLSTGVAAFVAAMVDNTDWQTTAKQVVMIAIGVVWLVLDQQRRISAWPGGQNSAHRHADHRIGVTGPAGIP